MTLATLMVLALSSRAAKAQLAQLCEHLEAFMSQEKLPKTLGRLG